MTALRELLFPFTFCLVFFTVSSTKPDIRPTSCQRNSPMHPETPLGGVPKDSDNILFSYAVDPRMTEKLALLEEKIVKTLNSAGPVVSQIPNASVCQSLIKYYIDEYNKDSKAIPQVAGLQRAVLVPENPLLTYRMIQRIIMVLLERIIRDCGVIVERDVGDLFVLEELGFPTDEDFDDAVMAVLRIQYIYGLTAYDIRRGVLGGISTGVKLSYEDCLTLAMAAMELGQADVIAYQWLMMAPIVQAEEQGSKKNVVNITTIDVEDAWKQLLEMTELETKNVMQRMYHKKEHQPRMDMFYEYETYGTCRGEFINAPMLRCYNEWERHGYFYINPMKIEVLSYDPVVVQIYDLVENSAIDYMLDECGKTLVRAIVFNNDTSVVETSYHRPAMSCWLEEKGAPILTKLNKKFEKLTGLEVVKKGASNLELVIYGAGGFYNFHLDSLQGINNPSVDEQGDRQATILVYLTEVQSGGYTGFPELGVYARPIKGSAVLFFPIMLNGKQDERTIHGGCPVILGSKIIANKWIMQYENTFKQPCSLMSDV